MSASKLGVETEKNLSNDFWWYTERSDMITIPEDVEAYLQTRRDEEVNAIVVA
jgi:hypothetical protein